jgi:hypothetical protein
LDDDIFKNLKNEEEKIVLILTKAYGAQHFYYQINKSIADDTLRNTLNYFTKLLEVIPKGVSPFSYKP